MTASLRLFGLVIRYVIWFVAIMAVIRVFEIDITPFLPGAGIAGIAVALAAQDLISNFFGGAIITVDKPFKVGDRIKVDRLLWGCHARSAPRARGSRPWITRS